MFSYYLHSCASKCSQTWKNEIKSHTNSPCLIFENSGPQCNLWINFTRGPSKTFLGKVPKSNDQSMVVYLMQEENRKNFLLVEASDFNDAKSVCGKQNGTLYVPQIDEYAELFDLVNRQSIFIGVRASLNTREWIK